MDIPAKFSSIEPSVSTIIEHSFAWKRHPVLPELEFFCLKERNYEEEQLLQIYDHSWQWCYLWECGVTLGRWILDNPHIVKDKIVYDLGTGQGTLAIAAKRAGARISIGIDNCVYSEFALAVNADRNNVTVSSYTKDLYDAKIAEQSIILASAQSFPESALDFLAELSETSTVIIAQLGMSNPKYMINHEKFHHIMEYNVLCNTPGLESVDSVPVSVWTCNPSIVS